MPAFSRHRFFFLRYFMTDASNSLALVADIGGTNARFALTDISTAHPVLSHSLSLPAADFASLQHAIEHYLAKVGAKPRLASLAVACPVLGDDIRLTNRAWAFSQNELISAPRRSLCWISATAIACACMAARTSNAKARSP